MIKSKKDKANLLWGTARAICYSGFREGQHPDRGEGANNPSYEETLEDLKILEDAGYSLIRIYDSGENSQTILKVIKENQINLKVLLGIWLKAEKSNHKGCVWLKEPIPEKELEANSKENLLELERGIDLCRQYSDIIISVNVGNEALVEWNDHGVPVEKVISYVRKVKSQIGQPVTVAENFHWWVEKGDELAEAVDYLAIHIYPVWNGSDIDEAMNVTQAEAESVLKKYPEKQVVITEAGWPSEASEFQERATIAKQKRHYEELFAWAEEANITTFFFEAFDEPWKGNPKNPLGAEKHWGLWDVKRQAKF